MNNTHKLLRAFIEASGFEIESTIDYDEQKIPPNMASTLIERGNQITDTYILKSHFGEYEVDEQGYYIQILQNPIVDYKVTNKPVDAGSMG